MVDLQALSEAVYKGRMGDVSAMVQNAIDEGVAPENILYQGLVIGMERLGEDFRVNKVYVPEVLIAARAMKAGMAILRPKLQDADIKMTGTVVIGTVKGDLHDIGKNLVAMMLEGSGFRVIDLGVDVSPEKFLAAAQEHNAQVIAISALLTTTMVNMKAVIDLLTDHTDLCGKVKVMIGGAPITQHFADEIHADGYSPDAASAVTLAKQLVSV